ncbi:MAG: flavin-dependent oxidoreductase [Anaerolineae bacterium]|nr:flavin-dependent oxidoreductase [Anaerolineae bacterium]
MRSLIVGSGIGGLTTALQLHRLGLEVLIFESVHQIKPLGAGINLLPHGAKALIELGLGERLTATGIQTREIKYLTKYGQEIYGDSRGLYAGFKWPQVSIHRGHLQFLLLDAVLERLGPECLLTGHHLVSFEQTTESVTAHFVDKTTGRPLDSYTGDLLVAADGIHSVARRQLYPDEGPAHFSGVMMWRGVAETEPFLDGETMIIAGNFKHKAVVYPISNELRQQGRSLTNWVMEIRVGGDRAPEIEDWNRRGDLSEFLYAYRAWTFDFIDIPAILHATKVILRYPMVDRDPLPRWSFGRATLLGDAAHPMYPMGANGASQAILDAVALAEALQNHEADIEAALRIYERTRLGPTSDVVNSNRQYGPEAILQIVEDRMTSPDDRVEDVITRAEIDQITLGYRKIAGFDVEDLNRS